MEGLGIRSTVAFNLHRIISKMTRSPQMWTAHVESVRGYHPLLDVNMCLPDTIREAAIAMFDATGVTATNHT